MRNCIAVLVFVVFAVVTAGMSFGARDWAIQADYTETCSCNPTCPCLFGSPPTRGYCKGNNLIEIKKGYYGDVRVDGISVMTAFDLGKWLKIYISENATDEQQEAVLELLKLKQTFGNIYAGKSEILAYKKMPISIEKTSTRITFSVPGSMAVIEKMRGRNGKPIKILNLPQPYTEGHTQYKSITMGHKSKDKTFEFSGTNGLTSTINVSSAN